MPARRIVSRTWKCDRVLDQIVKKVFVDTDGIVQQIHFSDVLRSMYAQNVRAMQFIPLWNEISDKFSAAKHRFDSWSMSFAKVCLTLDAVIRTAQSAHEERKNEKVGHAARTFLDILSEETVLLIGMLADAGEENLQLTRRLDSERTTSGKPCHCSAAVCHEVGGAVSERSSREDWLHSPPFGPIAEATDDIH